VNETMLEQIAEKHRVPCKLTGQTNDDEKIVPGKRGHLWQDGPALMICYTDDGCKRPLTPRHKTNALAKLGDAVVRITQNATAEFCAEIRQDHKSVERAIRVVGVRRFKITKGIPRPGVGFIPTASSGALFE